MLTLTGLVEDALAAGRGRTALVFEGRRLSYDELERASRGAMAVLREAGVRRGDHVALLLTNGLEFPVFDVAIVRLGAAKVPLNDRLTAPDVAFCLEHSGARAVVVSPELLPLARAASVAAVIVARPAEVLGADAPEAERCAVDPEDPAALFYTGGTTGRPKGVLHTQGGMALNLLSTVMEAEIGRDERLLLTTPLAHAAGLLTMTAIARGAEVHLTRGFDPAAVLEAIERDAITWTFAVPTMIYRLLDALGGQRPRGALRTVLYGAAPIDPDRLGQALDALGPVFLQLYGQTECPNFATTLSKADHVRARDEPRLLESCGRPVLLADVSVRDDAGRALGPGEPGEVCVRAPYVMARLHRDPEGTAARFHGPWLRTGDVGALDDEGYLHLKDRLGDMVISGGMNVYSAVVERVVMAAPGVGQAAVIGIPDPDWGEAVHAVVTPAGAALDPDAVLGFCRANLAAYMRPKSLEVVDTLPLTPYGKVDKKTLRAPYWAHRRRQIG